VLSVRGKLPPELAAEPATNHADTRNNPRQQDQDTAAGSARRAASRASYRTIPMDIDSSLMHTISNGSRRASLMRRWEKSIRSMELAAEPSGFTAAKTASHQQTFTGTTRHPQPVQTRRHRVQLSQPA